MAYVVLPSETARLVYGYLVAENLNDVASQFLETSPYMMECSKLIKQGHSVNSINTKLFSKDLNELLQEYSNIYYLAKSKIKTLPKSSFLFKRIRLKCETLGEIIDMLLFWKYKYQKKGDDNLTKARQELLKDNNSPSTTEQISTSNNNNSKINCSKNDDVNVNDSKNINEPISTSNNNHPQDESQNCTSSQVKMSNRNEIFNDRINFETTLNSNDLDADSDIYNKTDNRLLVNKSNAESCEIENTNAPKETSNISNMNSQIQAEGPCLSESTMEVDPVAPYEEENQSDNEGNDEVVSIETQSNNENQDLDLYQDSLKTNKAHINDGNKTENSPFVYLDSAVGNFKISPDPNQIIVIPINYYNENGTTSNQNVGGEEVSDLTTNVDCNQENDFSYQVFVEDPVSTPTEPTAAKDPVIDSNIITAENSVLPPAMQSQVVVVQPNRFRKILPRSKKKALSPAIVYVNVPAVNVDCTKPSQEPQTQSAQLQTESQQEPKLKENNSYNNKRRNSRSYVNARKRAISQKIRSPINRNMPNISTITLDDSPLKEGDASNTVSEPTDNKEADKAGEEKENKEEKMKSKIETPSVSLTTRNPKRLSLSTPRRRSSHIRALEFETPPKTNDEKKKSQTSPKVKVDQVTVERKSVRNTLFKSPDLETVFKSPACLKTNEKTNLETTEPLNELSIPIATRSPKVPLDGPWDELTGMGCVLDNSNTNEERNNKPKSWDSDLRSFLPNPDPEIQLNEKKRSRKPEKTQKDNKKPVKKKLSSGKKSKTSPPAAPSSALKINLTAKRNTYSISEDEEKSPVRPFQEDANLVTPFKYPEAVSEETPHPKRSGEDTPITITKLLRENGCSMDIDLSMISTPVFPPTPSLLDEDLSVMSEAKYFSPSKDDSKLKTPAKKITDYFSIDPSKSKREETHETKTEKIVSDIKNPKTKETHEKIVSDIITKAQEVVGLKSDQEEPRLKLRPSGGKMLSMHKMITIATSDKKLIENIPINDESSFQDSLDERTIMENSAVGTPELKSELEEKRKRTVQKCKDVKENLSTKNKIIKRFPRKRGRSGGEVQKNDKKPRLEISSDTTGGKLTESDESGRKDAVIVHSTPYADRRRSKLENSGPERQVIADSILSVIPKFEDHMNVQNFPELSPVWRKKVYYVEEFLKLTEISEYLKNFKDENPSILELKPDWISAFKIFYSWAKEINGSEMQASDKTKGIAQAYLAQVNKVKKGLKNKFKKNKRDLSNDMSSSKKNSLDAVFKSYELDKSRLSDNDEEARPRKRDDKKKEEEVEDGVASTLPLKKRKANVQPLEKENSTQEMPEDLSTTSNENFNNQSQKEVLRNLDVEDVLYQIHKQTDR